MRSAHLVPLLLCAACACGGRYERTIPGSDDTPNQAGTPPAFGAGGGASPGGGNGGGGSLPSDEQECVAAFRTYDEYRQQLIEHFESVGCKTASDCVAFHDQSNCDASCFRIATGARRGLSDRLNQFKLTACSAACQAEPLPACLPAAPAQCVDGRCL